MSQIFAKAELKLYGDAAMEGLAQKFAQLKQKCVFDPINALSSLKTRECIHFITQ